MAAQGPAPRRPLVMDPVYNSPLVSQLVNKVLLRGKAVDRREHRYGASRGLRDKSGNRTRSSRSSARSTTSSRPSRSRGRPRRWRDLPVPGRGQSPGGARPWRCAGCQLLRQRREKTMTDRLNNELLDASNGLGASVKRREGHHKMAGQQAWHYPCCWTLAPRPLLASRSSFMKPIGHRLLAPLPEVADQPSATPGSCSARA